MESIDALTDEQISRITEKARNGESIRYNLPGSGKIKIEKTLPYILVYRHRSPQEDPGTVRLVLSDASYLIIGENQEDFKAYQNLISSLADALSTEFKSCLVFELWAGESGSKTFIIKGPADRIPTTIDVLDNNLSNLDRWYTQLKLNTKIEDTLERYPPGREPLLNLEDLKRTGSLLVGMEIPPVYRSSDKQLFPVFFRSFHDRLLKIFHLTFYDFIRVQTSCGVANYSALGRGSVDDAALDIDRKLTAIEEAYEFLWLVSPSNIKDIKNTFFESKYEKVLDYHYRLLPIDPDMLKRKLYNLRIEDIDDPTVAFLFRDKREEIDHQITMLNERGTRDFFYNSIRLYKGVDRSLLQQAKEVLEKVEEQEQGSGNAELIDAEEFAELARKEFAHFKEQDEKFEGKLQVREDVNVMMVSQGKLYIPAEAKMLRSEANALIQHEVGTHMLTYYNGSNQIFSQLACGLADYDALQEGIAVMSEYLVGGLTANRLRTLAGRVVAGAELLEGAEFQEIFRSLHKNYGFSPGRAFNITSRIMQGGGFLKDIIYLKGLVALREHLQNGGELEPLLVGKIAVRHIGVIKELTDRKMLIKPPLRPGYLSLKQTPERLQRIRDGLPLHEMISS